MRLLKTHDKLNKFGIPLGYTRVEYLQSTGTQWIDTGILIGDMNYRIVLYAMPMTSTTNCLLGAMNTSSGYPGILINEAGSFRYGTQEMTAVTLTDSVRYKFDLTYQKLIVNNTDIYNSAGTTLTAPIEYSMYLFARNSIGAAKNFSSCRLYGCQIYHNDILLQNFIPCLDLLGKPCLYDLVGQKSYYNLGSDVDFTYGRKIIPVEYLETNGSQYIDTGINPTDNYGYRIKNTYKVGGGEQCAIGAMDAGNRFVGVYTGGSQISGGWGSFVNYLVGSYKFTDDTVWDVSCNYKNDRQIIVDGESLKDLTDIHVEGTITNTVYLFARHYGNNLSVMKGKIYEAEITEGLDIVANYIPCKDENDIGFMFDVVESKVYSNIGTGSFIIGEEVYDYKNTVRFIKDKIIEDLPRGYTRVEYIEAENSGNTVIQYAVGNYRLTDTTDWEITFSAAHSGNTWIIGQPTWIGVHYRRDATTNNLTKVGITNNANTTSQCYVDYTDNEKITLALKGTDVYANGVNAGSITRVSAASTQTKYGIFAYKDISQELPNLRVESAKIYDIKIWDNNILVQHLVPVLDINGEGCFYDTVNKTTIRKEDDCTSNFTTGSRVSSGLRLLAGGSIEDYIFLDYLESTTANQYIDTGVVGDYQKGVELEVEILANLNNGCGVGSWGDTTTQRDWLFYVFDNNFRVGFGSSNASNGITASLNTWYKWKAITVDGRQQQYINDELVFTSIQQNFTTNYNLYLFGMNNKGTFEYQLRSRMKYVKLYDGDTLIRNFLPALRKSDSKPGMYDMVEGKFYVNQAAGADFNYGYKQ